MSSNLKPSKRDIMRVKIIKSIYIHELDTIKANGNENVALVNEALRLLVKEKSVSLILELKNMHLLTPHSFVKGIVETLNGSNTKEIIEKQQRIREEKFKENLANKTK